MRTYKPSLNNFRRALERIDERPSRVLHAAQSLYHDIVPARTLGFATVWVNRRKGRPGQGAVVSANAKPDIEVPDMMTLAGGADKLAAVIQGIGTAAIQCFSSPTRQI